VIEQIVEVVSGGVSPDGKKRLLDTCLVRYAVTNKNAVTRVATPIRKPKAPSTKKPELKEASSKKNSVELPPTPAPPSPPPIAYERHVPVSNAAAPFGGIKHSGLGREGGTVGIKEFLETKYVAVAT